MHRDDYRRAMKKVRLSQESREQLLEKMRAAEQGRAVPMPRRTPVRRWVLAGVAAALVLAAVPLGLYASGGLDALSAAPQAAAASSAPSSAAADCVPDAGVSSAQQAQPAPFLQEEVPASQWVPPAEVGQPSPDAQPSWQEPAFGAGTAESSSPDGSAALPEDSTRSDGFAGIPSQSASAPAADAQAQPPAGQQDTAVQGSAGQAKYAAAPAGQVVCLSEAVSGNPSLDLPEADLPARLPTYTASRPDTESARAQLEQLAGVLGLQVEAWQEDDNGLSATAGAWTLRYDTAGISVTGQGVLLARGAGVSEECLGEDYAARLQALCPGETFSWERTGGFDAQKRPTGDVRLYVAAGDSLTDRLFHYCFETITLQLDASGNAVGLTASSPQLTAQVAQVARLRSLSEAQALLDLSGSMQVLHWELVYVHGTDGVSVVPAYKFTVTTGEDLAGYFSDGDAAGYAAVKRVYISAVADAPQAAASQSSSQAGQAAASLPAAPALPAAGTGQTLTGSVEDARGLGAGEPVRLLPAEVGAGAPRPSDEFILAGTAQHGPVRQDVDAAEDGMPDTFEKIPTEPFAEEEVPDRPWAPLEDAREEAGEQGEPEDGAAGSLCGLPACP